MIPFTKIAKTTLRDQKGFSLMELMVVIAIIAVLAAFAVFNYIPMRAKSMDSVAHADARNIVSSVVNAITSKANVDYEKGTLVPAVGLPGAVGNSTNGGVPGDRTAIFSLSQGVEARIVGSSNVGGNTVFTAWIYHTGGTTDAGSDSGKKEYWCEVDELSGIASAPQY